MTTDQPPTPPERVQLANGYEFDPAQSIVTDGEGPDIRVSVIDGLILSEDGETFGAYDPELAPGEVEEEKGLAPAWAERMMARLGRYNVRKTLLAEELKRVDEACSKRIGELADQDEDYRTLSLRRANVVRLMGRTASALEFLANAYRPILFALAEERLKGSTRRTFDLIAGSLSLRRVPAKIALSKDPDHDEEETIEALLSLGQTDAIKREVRISGISDALKEKILAEEATVSGIVVQPAREDMTIKAGGGNVC